MEGSSYASSSTYQHYRSPFGDTTLTKVFVGGLAWETPTEKMREYFEQFGEILEAVIITDKNTGKSKGYGFVTFGDPESAKRAVVDANPMIDGRRANCNIAATGRPRQSPPRGRGQGQSGQIYYPGGAQGGSSSVQGPLLTTPPPVPQSIPVMYPPYGYTGYNPAYGYNQAAFYNQQLQQAQYYQQMYGSSAAASSTASPNLQQPPHHPYYYTYSTQAAAGYPTMPQHAQRSQGPYFYYSSHSPFNQSSTGSYPVHPQLLHRQPQQDYQPSSVSSDSSRHQQLPSQIGYNPAYGYNQAAFYNQQLQQAQYYQQMYGSSAAASSTASPNLQQPPHHPYYYTYSTQAAAGYPTMPQHAQRSQGPYFYYSSHSPFNQSSTGSYPVHPQLLHRQPQQDYQPSVSSDSSRHQQLPSQIDSHESSQATSPEPEAKVVPSESPSDV